MPTNTRLDIILPCYNPHSGWQKEWLLFHEEAKERYELNYLLVNDGSHNGELEKVLPELRTKGLSVQYIDYTKNRGKGYALREGVKAAKAPYLLYTDVDFPFTNHSVFQVADQLIAGACDVVAGTRQQAYYDNTMSTFRKTLSRCFRWMLRNLLRMQITDTQCGLKAFNAKGKEEFLKTRVNRYLFDFEFIYRSSHQKGMTICPINVELKANVQFRKMPLRILLQELLNLFRVLLFTRFT